MFKKSSGGRDWRISLRCGTGACVEIATENDAVYMRNSTDPNGPMVVFSHENWSAFLGRVTRGELAG